MPVWKRVVRVYPHFYDRSLDFSTRRDAIVAKLRASGWPDTNLEVAELVDELAETADEAEFNDTWDAIYDEADQDRTWIDIWGPTR